MAKPRFRIFQTLRLVLSFLPFLHLNKESAEALLK